MTDPWHIPIAAWDKDLTQLVVIIILLVIAAISGLVKKAQEKAAAYKRELRRRQAEAGEAPQTPQAQAPHPPTPYPQQRVRRPREQVTVPLPQRLARVARVAQQTVVPHEHEEVHQRVATVGPQPDISVIENETDRRRARARNLEAVRHQRLSAPSPAEADGAAISARILHVPAAPGGAARLAAGVAVGLTDPDALRRAIVYREVLGPSKGLRDEPEMWDL